MKTKNRKLLVFWVVHITLVCAFAAILLKAPDQLAGIGVMIIGMIVGNGTAFIGGNVFEAWQRSKYYRPELAAVIDSNPQRPTIANSGGPL